MPLRWPDETVLPRDQTPQWSGAGSNLVLDFHGDPIKADLAVFSDGNHHMALLPALQAFYAAFPRVADIFYATTPPAPIMALLESGALRLGNLCLSVKPHLFLGPAHVLERLQTEGHLREHGLLARNQGSVLLVRLDNPRQIAGLADLMRPDVRLFISNPDTETVSYSGYRQTLEGVAASQGLDLDLFRQAVFGATVVRGRCIHHREAPEAVAAGAADAAIVYYHLALRYTRLFADTFDFIPLGGTKTRPAPFEQNRTGAVHMGVVGDGGPWGARLAEFLKSRQVADIYAEHGLRHVLDL